MCAAMMQRPTKQHTTGSGGRDSAISFESTGSGSYSSGFVSPPKTTSPPIMDPRASIASRTSGGAEVHTADDGETFGIPDGAQVLATKDGDACYLVDLSFSRSPAAIKERVYAKLGIYDDDQAQYRISRARGGHSIGGFLDDWMLWDLCMRIGPESDPPMLMVLLASAHQQSSSSGGARSIASPKSVDQMPLSAGTNRSSRNSSSPSAGGGGSGEHHRGSRASPDAFGQASLPPPSSGLYRRLPNNGDQPPSPGPGHPRASAGSSTSGGSLLSPPHDEHRDRAGSLTPTAPPFPGGMGGPRSPSDEGPPRKSTDSGASDHYFAGAGPGLAEGGRMRYHKEPYHPPSASQQGGGGGATGGHTRRPSEPTKGSQPMSAVDRQPPPASAYPVDASGPSASVYRPHHLPPLRTPSSTPANYVATFPVPSLPPAPSRQQTLEPPGQQRRVSPHNYKSMDDMRTHFAAGEPPPLHPSMQGGGHGRWGSAAPRYPSGSQSQVGISTGPGPGSGRGHYPDYRGTPPPPHPSGRLPPPPPSGRILPAQPGQPGPSSGSGRSASVQPPPQHPSIRPPPGSGGPVPFSTPQPSRVGGPQIVYPPGGPPGPPQWGPGPPAVSAPMGRAPSAGTQRSVSTGPFDQHHRFDPRAGPRPRERDASPRPPSTYESPSPGLHAPSPLMPYPHAQQRQGWDASTSLGQQHLFQRTPVPMQPGQTLQEVLGKDRERMHRPPPQPGAHHFGSVPPPNIAPGGGGGGAGRGEKRSQDERPDYIIAGATYHPPPPQPQPQAQPPQPQSGVDPAAQRIQKTASRAESSRSSTSSSSAAASPSRMHPPASSLRDSASIRSSQGSELLTPATDASASAASPVSKPGEAESTAGRERASSVGSFHSAHETAGSRPPSIKEVAEDEQDEGEGTAKGIGGGGEDGDSWARELTAFVNQLGGGGATSEGDGTLKPNGSGTSETIALKKPEGEQAAVRFRLPEAGKEEEKGELTVPKPLFDFEDDEEIPDGTFMHPMTMGRLTSGGNKPSTRPTLTLDTAPAEGGGPLRPTSRQSKPPSSSASTTSSATGIRNNLRTSAGSGDSGVKSSPIRRKTSFAKREGDWAFRPEVDQVYENLEEWFPEHDLDKPIDIGPLPAELAAPSSPATSLTEATSPAKSTVSAPSPALPLSKLKGRARSIRVVAQERKRWLSKTEEKAKAERRRPEGGAGGGLGGAGAGAGGGARARGPEAGGKGAQAAGSGALLRRKSTKLWGAKIEEVTPGQQVNIPSTVKEAIDEDPDNFSFKWVKGELIGKGSFGQVYLALNATTGEMLAVKQVELPKTISDRDDVRQNNVVQALKGEISLMRDLEHGNIVQYLGYEETTAYLSIFLEYVPGGSIGRCLRKHGAFEDPVIQFFTLQVLEGLRYLHSQNILHRDLKADNLLVDLSGVVKISDFGISKRVDNIWEENQNMSIQGSIFWMAPEVVYNPGKKGYNAKVDIWSLGCVVLEMFAGRRPWSDDEAMQAVFKLGAERSRPPVPPDVKLKKMPTHFLDQCFQIHPDHRPTADRLLDHRFLELAPEWNFEDSKLYKAIKLPR